MFPHAANCRFLLHSPLAYVKNPKAHYATNVYHMAISTNSSVNRTARLQCNIRKCARGKCEGSRSRDCGLRSSSVALAVIHCTRSNDPSAIYFNIILLVMFISHTRSRQTKYSGNYVKIASFISELLLQVGRLCRPDFASCTAGSAAS